MIAREVIAFMKLEVRNGVSISAVARKYGVSRQTVYNHTRKSVKTDEPGGVEGARVSLNRTGFRRGSVLMQPALAG